MSDADAGSFNFTLASSYPSSDTAWTVNMYCVDISNGGSPANVTLYAICAQ